MNLRQRFTGIVLAAIIFGLMLGLLLVLATELLMDRQAGAKEYRPGDADCSGIVTVLDTSLVLQSVVGLSDSPPCKQAADMNGSGSMDVFDAYCILQEVS